MDINRIAQERDEAWRTCQALADLVRPIEDDWRATDQTDRQAFSRSVVLFRCVCCGAFTATHDDNAICRSVMAMVQSQCGHPVSAIASAADGTQYCRACEMKGDDDA